MLEAMLVEADSGAVAILEHVNGIAVDNDERTRLETERRGDFTSPDNFPWETVASKGPSMKRPIGMVSPVPELKMLRRQATDRLDLEKCVAARKEEVRQIRAAGQLIAFVLVDVPFSAAVEKDRATRLEP